MLADLFEEADLKQAEIGALIGCTQSAVSNKLAGRRPWAVDELLALRPELARRLGRDVSLDEMVHPAESTTQENVA